MRSFFQQLERGSVRYLLISGQACVLYGASLFSEDVAYWSPILAELREMRRAGSLLPEGSRP